MRLEIFSTSDEPRDSLGIIIYATYLIITTLFYDFFNRLLLAIIADWKISLRLKTLSPTR